jgi:hypothetical protein
VRGTAQFRPSPGDPAVGQASLRPVAGWLARMDVRALRPRLTAANGASCGHLLQLPSAVRSASGRGTDRTQLACEVHISPVVCSSIIMRGSIRDVGLACADGWSTAVVAGLVIDLRSPRWGRWPASTDIYRVGRVSLAISVNNLAATETTCGRSDLYRDSYTTAVWLSHTG